MESIIQMQQTGKMERKKINTRNILFIVSGAFDNLGKLIRQRLDDSLDAALMDILLLLVFNVLFFMLSYLFFLRYDVT